MRPLAYARFCAEVLCLNSPPMRAQGTFRQMRQVLREFGSLPDLKTTADVKPSAIASWIKAHPDRTPVRTASLLRSLSSACKYAVSEGYLRQSPFGYRRVNDWIRNQAFAPETPRPQRHHSCAAIARLLLYVDAQAGLGSWKAGRLQALIYLLAYTGLRKGEALHLRAFDVDLDRRAISIEPRRSHTLKTKRSAATLPLADPLVEVLRLWIPRCGGQWVFPGVRLGAPWTGGPPGQKPIDQIRLAGEAVGIEGMTFMGFRKTLGTLAKSWGLGQLELKALLRHSNVETQKWYDEEQVESLRPAVSKVQFRIQG